MVEVKSRYSLTVVAAIYRVVLCSMFLAHLSSASPAAKGPPSLFEVAKIPDDIAAAKRLRNTVLADRHRPGFHYVAPEGHAHPMDPNGAIFWKGRYHLFYLYQEPLPSGASMHSYAHLSSIDLVHWRHHPPALYPTADSADRNMLSGNCFIDSEGAATMVYCSWDKICVAKSTDKLLDHWTRLPKNPIFAVPVSSSTDKQSLPYDAWDPHCWLENGTYYIITGGRPVGRGKGEKPRPASLLKSTELGKGWEYVGPLLAKEMPEIDAADDLSCPDLFKLGNKHVLLGISHHRGARYYVGEWRDEQFFPEYHHWLSREDSLVFAPESLQTPDGRRVMWMWMRQGAIPGYQKAKGSGAWSGGLSLPIELTPPAAGESQLGIAPVRELKTLRYNPQTIAPFVLSNGENRLLPSISGDSLEVRVRLRMGASERAGVEVLRSPGCEEVTSIYYDASTKQLVIDTSRSTQGALKTRSESTPFELAKGEDLELRIFVDHSVVDVFANGREYAARMVFPERADSLGVATFTQGDKVEVLEFSTWEMMPSNPF